MIDKKGGDIILLDISKEAIFTDYFLICNGENDRQQELLPTALPRTPKRKPTLCHGEQKGSHPVVGYCWIMAI